MTLLTFIKKKLGLYKTGYCYYIKTKDIIVPHIFANTTIRPQKWKHKLNYYRQHAKFESPIIIDSNFILVDGYSSYRIAKFIDMDEVPVYFIDNIKQS